MLNLTILRKIPKKKREMYESLPEIVAFDIPTTKNIPDKKAKIHSERANKK